MAASMRLSRSLKSDSACVGQRELGLMSTVVLGHGLISSEGEVVGSRRSQIHDLNL